MRRPIPAKKPMLSKTLKKIIETTDGAAQLVAEAQTWLAEAASVADPTGEVREAARQLCEAAALFKKRAQRAVFRIQHDQLARSASRADE